MRRMLATLLPLALVVAAGCHDSHDLDSVPPAAPGGAYSVTGDDRVELFWSANSERDLEGYRVYRGPTSTGPWTRVATVGVNAYTDYGVVNGETYYYEITAYDEAGNESDPSVTLRDTPRPEGTVTLYTIDTYPDDAGFDFSASSRVAYDCGCADLWLDEQGSATLLVAPVGTEIQDAGYATGVGGLTKVDWAPDGGWSPTGTAEVVGGHVYVIWTADNHFAALYARSLTLGESASFDWAYQLEYGNPELVAALRASRPQRRAPSQ